MLVIECRETERQRDRKTERHIDKERERERERGVEGSERKRAIWRDLRRLM